MVIGPFPLPPPARGERGLCWMAVVDHVERGAPFDATALDASLARYRPLSRFIGATARRSGGDRRCELGIPRSTCARRCRRCRDALEQILFGAGHGLLDQLSMARSIRARSASRLRRLVLNERWRVSAALARRCFSASIVTTSSRRSGEPFAQAQHDRVEHRFGHGSDGVGDAHHPASGRLCIDVTPASASARRARWHPPRRGPRWAPNRRRTGTPPRPRSGR